MRSFTILHPPRGMDGVIVRGATIGRNTVTQDRHVYNFPSLEQARALFESSGLACFPRFEEDDPSVIETWL